MKEQRVCPQCGNWFDCEEKEAGGRMCDLCAEENCVITLSFLAQQYGLTVDDVVEEFGCKKENVIVEPNPDK